MVKAIPFVLQLSAAKGLISIVFPGAIMLTSDAVQAQADRAIVAFYNVENLFDTRRDTSIFDKEWTPDGNYAWDSWRYTRKLRRVAWVITSWEPQTGQVPAVIGLCEVENYQVLEDLIAQPALRPSAYSIIHHDSPDRRGIDVAALYRKDRFRLLFAQTHRVLIYSEEGYRKYTRDILVIHGLMDGEPIHILINHWPSRSGGIRRSQGFRLAAAHKVAALIDSIRCLNSEARIIVMGDLNDNPEDESVRYLTESHKVRRTPHDRVDRSYGCPVNTLNNDPLINPFERLFERGWGTLAHGVQWQLYDQLLVSGNLLNASKGWRIERPGILALNKLRVSNGPNRGSPWRTFAYGSYTGGYSDHFPVYLILKHKKPDSLVKPLAPGNPGKDQ